MRNKIFFLISIVILFISFQFNFLKSVPAGHFSSFQYDSESLVIGRLVESKINGVFSNNGQLGYASVDNLKYGDPDFFGGGKKAFLNSNIPFSYNKYNSQFGFQGVLFSVSDKILSIFDIPVEYHLKIFHAATSLFLVIILSSILYVFSIEFGLLPVAIALAGIACSDWLILFARNLYWVAGFWFFPMLIVLWVHYKEKINNTFSWDLTVIMVFTAVFLKSLSGYEYISTILLSMIVPIVYYALIMKWSWMRYIQRTLIIGVAGLCGFISAFCIHLWQLFLGTKDITKAFELIYQRVTIRTFTDPSSLDTNSIDLASAKSDVITVLLTYLKGSSLYGHFSFLFLISVIAVASLIGIICLIKCDSLQFDKLKFKALLITTWVSILAPISWYVLAKGHSFVHVHMNYVLWYIPYIIYGFILVGYVVNITINKLISSMNK
ncbi:hypothetical protein AU255_13060 [Methyloprofundus sedimenti]|uniref:Glycosyltransferase RgtA/B/C/D-like domain-containing protein n=1 Tax=Methyloprofundus sedimenti TaxID=1420851 RepID=A0A1V8M3E7_9GAMM|nr:hypothetical protein [Methyloprofundus sedimenti]OQK16038.1 hypothetical protein AU255_13060 [Methyloprofundus sedimenti]